MYAKHICYVYGYLEIQYVFMALQSFVIISIYGEPLSFYILWCNPTFWVNTCRLTYMKIQNHECLPKHVRLDAVFNFIKLKKSAKKCAQTAGGELNSCGEVQ